VSAQPRKPHLIFEATNRCNLDCAYCYNVWKARPDYPQGELSTRATCRLLRKAIKEGDCEQVTFSGGEPTLRDDLRDLVAACRLRGVNTAVITNGARLSRELVRDLVSMGQELFELTLLSTDPEVHDSICGPGAWRRIVKSMDLVQQEGGRLALVFIIMRPTAGELEGVFREADRRGASLLLNRFNPGGTGLRHLELLQCPPKQLRRVLERADALTGELELLMHCGVPLPPCAVQTSDLRHIRDSGCQVAGPSPYPTLDPLGNLRPCNHSPTVLGNLRYQPFDVVTASPAAQAMARSLPEICVPCPAASHCRGGCRAASEQLDGDFNRVDPFARAAGIEERLPPG